MTKSVSTNFYFLTDTDNIHMYLISCFHMTKEKKGKGFKENKVTMIWHMAPFFRTKTLYNNIKKVH